MVDKIVCSLLGTALGLSLSHGLSGNATTNLAGFLLAAACLYGTLVAPGNPNNKERS